MWDRRHLRILIALIASAALHLLTFGGVRRIIFNPSGLGMSREHARRPEEEVQISLALLDPPVAPASPEEAIEKPRPELKKVVKPVLVPELLAPKPKPPEMKFPDDMGEASGKDVGSNKADGDEPLHAREGDEDQALLSREPGSRGRTGDKPARWLTSPGDNGQGGHPGASLAGSAAGATGQVTASPADPAAMVPASRQSHALAESDVHDVHLAAPTVKEPSERPADRTDPDSRSHAPARESLRLAVAAPERPEPAAAARIAPLVVTPRPQQQSAYASELSQTGDGDRGISGDRPDPVSADAGLLPRRVAQPTHSPGHNDEKVGTVQVPIPSAAPAKSTAAAEPLPQRALPRFALALAPAVPLPSPPTVSQPIESAHDMQPPRPAPNVLDLKPLPDQRPAPAAPSTPTASTAIDPAANAMDSAQPLRRTGDGRQPGAARPSADPGQKSDSESDAFSKIGSATFRDGRLDVRFGRKIKTVRPQIPVVGQIDSFAMGNPSVTMKVSISPTGDVTHVVIDKSSGSNEIDQPCLLAMYKWWFEPLKDPRGKPISDCVLFTIGFR